jgi:N-carbamoyl-L-amino-acid hydrolase
MAEAGLAVSVDAGGNLIGRREGLQPDLPCLMLGSHTGTVVGGGRFDGMVGVLAAIEAARCLAPLRRHRHAVHPEPRRPQHCPEEWTDVADMALGAQALTEAVRRLDAQ